MKLYRSVNDHPAPVAPGERPALVLLNPAAAGGRAAALAPRVRDWLATYAPTVMLVESDSIERSRATLQCLPRSSRVVLMGGDGTLHHMLPVLLTHRLAVGLVPSGSGNDTARALGLHGLPWQRALAHALSGATRRMDVGELIGPREAVPFISSLAAGFDAAVACRARADTVTPAGQLRYLRAVFGEISALRHWRVRATVDGRLQHDGAALFASVFNTPTYGSGMPALPQARIADAQLDLLVAGRFGRMGTLAMLPRLLRGSHLLHERVAARAFQSLRIESDVPIPLAADGEPLEPRQCYEVRLRASALAVVPGPVPAPAH